MNIVRYKGSIFHWELRHPDNSSRRQRCVSPKTLNGHSVSGQHPLQQCSERDVHEYGLV